MTVMMYSLHSITYPLSFYHADGANCCLVGIALGVTAKKNIPQ